MSIYLAGGAYTASTNAAITSYGTEVKLAYQGSGMLRDSVTLKTGVVGQSHWFRRMGAAVAYKQQASAEVITPNDTSHAKIEATLSNWRVGDYTDLFDQAETTVDERAALAKNHSMALGRAEDQLIIVAIDAATGIAGTVDEDLGGTNSLINADKIRRAKRYLRQVNSQGEHTMLVNAAGLEGALGEIEITSSDYQSFKALADGDATLNGKTTFGFRWKVMEDRVEGGLPFGSSSIRLCFAYDKAAVGLAVGLEPAARVDFIPERGAFLSQATQKAGSAVIDPKGVVEVQSYES